MPPSFGPRHAQHFSASPTQIGMNENRLASEHKLCKFHSLSWVVDDSLVREAHPRPHLLHDFLSCPTSESQSVGAGKKEVTCLSDNVRGTIEEMLERP